MTAGEATVSPPRKRSSNFVMKQYAHNGYYQRLPWRVCVEVAVFPACNDKELAMQGLAWSLLFSRDFWYNSYWVFVRLSGCCFLDLDYKRDVVGEIASKRKSDAHSIVNVNVRMITDGND